MTTINRNTWTDDDGSGTTGTIINNARLQGDVYDQVDAALAALDGKNTSQDSAITANGPHAILSTQHTNTVPAALVAGDLLAADATGKLARLPAGANGSLLGVTGGLPAWAVPTAGVWTNIPYAAGNFTAFGTMTWTVEAADQVTFAYTVIGRTCIVNVNLGGTTLAGTATGEIYIALPALITPGLSMNTIGRGTSPTLQVFAYVVAGTARIAIQPYAGGNFPIGTNTISVQFTLIFTLP